MASFGQTSNDRLDTVHEDLQRLFREVVKHYDCTVLEGMRTLERQRELYEADPPRTHTMASKHLSGDAVDITPYPVDWTDKCRQMEFATVVYDIAMKMGIRVRWGGRFRGFYDSPHWELLYDYEE